MTGPSDRINNDDWFKLIVFLFLRNMISARLLLVESTRRTHLRSEMSSARSLPLRLVHLKELRMQLK